MHGDFRVGDVLGKGFSIWFRNLPAFLVLSIVLYSPILAYTAAVLGSDFDADKLLRWSIVVGLLGIPLRFLVTAAVLYGTIQQLRGQHAGIGESIGVGLKRLLPVLAVGILAGLIVVLGVVLLVVGAFIFYCMFYVAVPAAVAERPGIGGALARSRELTAGYRWHIFGIIVILWVLGFVINKLLGNLVTGDAASLADIQIFVWVSVGIDIVFSALGATITGVVYHDLRVAKEGVATDDLARVFE